MDMHRKVLIVSTGDIHGGASIAAYRLLRGLLKAGTDAKMFVEKKMSDDPNVVDFKPNTSKWREAKRYMRKRIIKAEFKRYRRSRPEGMEIFTDIRTRYEGEITAQINEYDIVNLHFIAGFVDYNAFFENVRSDIPIIWTLHDMNAFTGGCHYAGGCEGYMNKCGCCPQLGSTRANDLSHYIWTGKKAIYDGTQKRRMHLVTPSEWLALEVGKSSLLEGYPVHVIPNGVDEELFMPHDRIEARKSLGLPLDEKIVLFVSDSIGNRRKGMRFLIEALGVLEKEGEYFFLSVGRGDPEGYGGKGVHLGTVLGEDNMSVVYSAADVFVIPSTEDNLPNTVLEAMACGTPVVAFDVGGIRDMVRPGKTGYLVEPEDVGGLIVAIGEIAGNAVESETMSGTCREVVEEEFTLRVQAEKYLMVYDSVLETSKGDRLS